jgi:hypothetical protein
MTLKRLELTRVELMPPVLEPGVLYVSEKYGTAAHLCACGCGSKIRTPLGPTEWSIRETPNGVTMRPSVGNWQKPCRSHYVIDSGEVVWSGGWSEKAVLKGRRAEEAKRAVYYDELARRRRPWFVQWLARLFGR